MDAFLTLLGAAIIAIWALALAWLAWAWLTGDRRQPPRRGPKRWTAGEAGYGAAKAWRKEARR